MSYEKAMKHSANVRKCRKQSGMYMGFDAGTGSWPNPRRNPYIAALLEVREWFSNRHSGDKQHNRECIREAIAECRKQASIMQLAEKATSTPVMALRIK